MSEDLKKSGELVMINYAWSLRVVRLRSFEQDTMTSIHLFPSLHPFCLWHPKQLHLGLLFFFHDFHHADMNSNNLLLR